MSIVGTLDEQIKSVCPIEGVSMGRANDKSTWRIDFKPEATDDQKKAAQAVADALDPNTVKAAADDPTITVSQLQAALTALNGSGNVAAAIAAVAE